MLHLSKSPTQHPKGLLSVLFAKRAALEIVHERVDLLISTMFKHLQVRANMTVIIDAGLISESELIGAPRYSKCSLVFCAQKFGNSSRLVSFPGLSKLRWAALACSTR